MKAPHFLFLVLLITQQSIFFSIQPLNLDIDITNTTKKIPRSAFAKKLIALREKCLYSEYFWSVFSRIRTEYEPEKLRIRTLFAQCWYLIHFSWCHSAVSMQNRNSTNPDIKAELLVVEGQILEKEQDEGKKDLRSKPSFNKKRKAFLRFSLTQKYCIFFKSVTILCSILPGISRV